MPMRLAKVLGDECPDAASVPEESLETKAAELDRLYRHEAPRLARFFRCRMLETDDAPDLVQEAFARLVSFMARETLANPAPYLQRIARNLLFERSRGRARQQAALHIPLEDQHEPAVPPLQEHAIEERDVLRIYRQALDLLPEKTRTIFLLHRVEECTYREIGERLGISIPTVQYHIARSLAHIDAALESK